MTPTGTLIGFDFGERRIGVAVGETSTRIANPLGAIEQTANEARFREIGRIVDEWQPSGFRGRDPAPFGQFRTRDRQAGREIRARLQARYNLPVEFIDETLTSAIAESQLRETRTRKARKSDVDALAAAMILQSYLDAMER